MSYSIFDASDRPRIDRLRARARRHGLRLVKSRAGYHWNNKGGLQLVDAERNTVIAGVDHDLTLDDAEDLIREAIAAR